MSRTGCRWHAIARRALQDGDVKAAHKATNAYLAAAMKLGLSPVDRQKIFAPPPAEEDELDQLMKLKMAR